MKWLLISGALVPIGSLISTSILAAAALVVLGASSAALVTNAPPMNSRRPICGIGFLRAECPHVRTASGPGSPSGQPDWGGGCDRINLVCELSITVNRI